MLLYEQYELEAAQRKRREKQISESSDSKPHSEPMMVHETCASEVAQKRNGARPSRDQHLAESVTQSGSQTTYSRQKCG